MLQLVTRSDPSRSLPEDFRAAMRQLPGGVSVITAGRDAARTGLTATSVVSFSADPPTLLVCVNKTASALPIIRRDGCFGVSVLAATQQDVADRFAGRDGVKGAARYEGATWRTLETGVWLLEGALANFDCEIDEIIERHSHAIVIGRVCAASSGEGGGLVHWRRAYRQISESGAE